MLRITTPAVTLLLALALVCARAARADTAPVPAAPTALATPAPAPAPAPKAKPKPRHVPLGTRAARFARHLLGIRYRWGGTSPRTGFDCSGLVRFVYGHFGVALPHFAYGQFELGRRVSRHGLRPGDLVFFDGVGHVGIYIGRGRFIHAPHTGTVVQISRLAGSYGRGYDGARRIVPV